MLCWLSPELPLPVSCTAAAADILWVGLDYALLEAHRRLFGCALPASSHQSFCGGAEGTAAAGDQDTHMCNLAIVDMIEVMEGPESQFKKELICWCVFLQFKPCQAMLSWPMLSVVCT